MLEDNIYITNHVENIKRKSLFFEKDGFSVVEVNEYIIKYLCDYGCSISIYCGRYSDEPEVPVRFENKGARPEQYSIGWFRNLKKFEAGEKNIFKKDGQKGDKLTSIYSLLEYLEENFDNVIDIEFCRTTKKKINENFEKNLWGI
jgi:hypothetical protein